MDRRPKDGQKAQEEEEEEEEEVEEDEEAGREGGSRTEDGERRDGGTEPIDAIGAEDGAIIVTPLLRDGHGA